MLSTMRSAKGATQSVSPTSRTVASAPRRLFLLSPASVGGERAKQLLNPAAAFDLAVRFRDEGAELGEVFSFLSGLYFRGKLTYARRFGRVDEIRVITPNRGLLRADQRLWPEDLRAFGAVDINEQDPAYAGPLVSAAESFRQELPPDGLVILLGSIATAKYRVPLLSVFGERLVFPNDFVGRGDMSRGALLLQRAAAGIELFYAQVAGAILSGPRASRIASR
jgi:hypothetical protein